MELSADEQAWLEEFQQALRDNYPGVVENLAAFEATEVSVPSGAITGPQFMVILKGSSDRDESAAELTWLAYKLARPFGLSPAISVYTLEEVEQRRAHNRWPYKGDGVSFWRGEDIARGGKARVDLPDWARPETWGLRLRSYEKEWLFTFCYALRESYSGLVQDVLVFANQDAYTHAGRSALNVVVKINGADDGKAKEKEFCELGYQITDPVDPTMPFIRVFTVAEWQKQLDRPDFPYFGEGTSVWLAQP